MSSMTARGCTRKLSIHLGKGFSNHCLDRSKRGFERNSSLRRDVTELPLLLRNGPAHPSTPAMLELNRTLPEITGFSTTCQMAFSTRYEIYSRQPARRVQHRLRHRAPGVAVLSHGVEPDRRRLEPHPLRLPVDVQRTNARPAGELRPVSGGRHEKHRPRRARAAADYVRAQGIDTMFGFDLGVTRPIYKFLRHAGVRHIISYWGAPMSSVNTGLTCLLKRLSVALSRHGPDHCNDPP